MYLIKSYKRELDCLVQDGFRLYHELLDNGKIGIVYDVDLKNLKVSLKPENCYKLDKKDIKNMDLILNDWIGLVNFGMKKDYMGILQRYKIGLSDMIIALSFRFFYPAKDPTLKKDLVKTFGEFKKYIKCRKINLRIRVQRTPGRELMNKFEGIFKNIQEGDFDHSIYLYNALSEFKMFDQEKYYRAFDEGIFNKKKL